MFSAIENSSTRPAALPVLGDVPDALVEVVSRGLRSSRRGRRLDAAGLGLRRPVIASISSVWPLPSTPAMPTISPARTSNETSATFSRPRSSERAGPHARGAPRPGWRRLVDPEQHLAPDHEPRELFLRRAFDAGRVSTTFPRRRTVMRSAISSTSFSLWLMKMIDMPSRCSVLEDPEELDRLLRREHGGRLVEDRGCPPAGRAPSGSRRAAAGRRVMSSICASGSIAKPKRRRQLAHALARRAVVEEDPARRRLDRRARCSPRPSSRG